MLPLEGTEAVPFPAYFPSMPGPVLYSTNPWFATEIASKYRGGNYFAWVSEYFDGACLRGLDVGEKIQLFLPITVETAMTHWRTRNHDLALGEGKLVA